MRLNLKTDLALLRTYFLGTEEFVIKLVESVNFESDEERAEFISELGDTVAETMGELLVQLADLGDFELEEEDDDEYDDEYDDEPFGFFDDYGDDFDLFDDEEEEEDEPVISWPNVRQPEPAVNWPNVRGVATATKASTATAVATPPAPTKVSDGSTIVSRDGRSRVCVPARFVKQVGFNSNQVFVTKRAGGPGLILLKNKPSSELLSTYSTDVDSNVRLSDYVLGLGGLLTPRAKIKLADKGRGILVLPA